MFRVVNRPFKAIGGVSWGLLVWRQNVRSSVPCKTRTGSVGGIDDSCFRTSYPAIWGRSMSQYPVAVVIVSIKSALTTSS